MIAIERFSSVRAISMSASGSPVVIALRISSQKRKSSRVVSHSIPCTPPTKQGAPVDVPDAQRVDAAPEDRFPDRKGL